ncbi:MAG: hypothetical protein EXS05_00305 [Planctomycetaceae bacterium]|nr:hypothetical protein [Planctomycetaceae bacterium]
MSLWSACGWSLARSLLIAVLAAPLAVWIERRLATLTDPTRRVAWCLLLLPLLFPTLLSGYAYACYGVSLQLANAAWWQVLPGDWPSTVGGWLAAHNAVLDEVLLCLMLMARSVPVGVLLLVCAPRPEYPPVAWHCRRLALGQARDLGSHVRAWLGYVRYGPWRSILAAGSLMYLIAFQEFELPSLLGRPAWTVWLFDAQVGGLALGQSLLATLLPLACELAVVLPLCWGWSQRSGEPAAAREPTPTSRVVAWRDGIYLVAAALMTSVVPLLLVGRDALQGLLALAANRLQWERLLKESLAGVLFSLVAAVIALRLASAIHRSTRGRRFVAWLAIPGLLGPGLLGPLVLGLGLVSLFQWPLLNFAYRTPVSLILGLVLFLLPRAWLVQLVVQASRRHAALHTASLLGESSDFRNRAQARELAWQMGTRGQFWSLSLLTYWGYLELTVAYLLGPVTIVSVPVLLYNQMHFGKNAILSAMTCLAVGVPVLIFLGVAALRPLVFRWLRR